PEANGAFCATPCVRGDRVWAAAAHDSAFRPYGAVYCVDRNTGKQVWAFHDNKKMRQVFSSPVLADGLLYIGAGVHQDMNCKLYCLDAATGEKKWEFPTQSHTEATPVVVDGKVYVGAGDDGVYCLDAKTGAKVWQFPGVHVDSTPAVSGGRVYCGAG